MTTIIPSFWSIKNCSQTCQNGRIAAVRFPLSLGKPLKIICRRSSILGSIAEASFGLFHRCFSFLISDLSMERENATFAMTDKSPSASSSAVVASSIVYLLGAFRYCAILQRGFKGLVGGCDFIREISDLVRNGQNPTAMITQPPNLTVDSADLVLAAFRAMLLFAARAHAVRTDFICSFKSEQGPSPIRHSRFQHQQQHTLQLTYYRHTPPIFKYISAYGSIILLPLRCLDKYSC
ncbi:hypothetical protein T03_5110 [Trichinella britovi]|uniref:Uncharacterized protein n=1 Tax=Trichinella britovi TaxID=45882 RepID=A0A0V1D2P3_TRIBR|nr:hypothetical protein T03_5110 [Trichinella britovi]